MAAMDVPMSRRISDENLSCRLRREQAQTGAITASLAWNDPSDLDLHAHVELADGGSAHIFYRSKTGAGGTLDVDMHARDSDGIVEEPVENIFWQQPPAGSYSIRANLYKKRGGRDAVPFRMVLKCEGEEDRSFEGELKAGPDATTECFRFVLADGAIEMQEPRPWAQLKMPESLRGHRATHAARRPRHVARRAARAAGPGSKAALARAKASPIAKGKKAKLLVFKGLKLKTSSGLRKGDLTIGKKGRVVSLKKHQLGKANRWALATSRARAAKGVVGFRLLKKGGSFYNKVKEIFSDM